MSSKTISVDVLARVEGEGGISVKLKNGSVQDVRFRIYEPPRFFEAFLRGRSFAEAPDITARICGICPVAYQMSAVHAMENAFHCTVDGAIRELRRLMYCGEWIESHALHIYMLHAPDFFNVDDVFQLAKAAPEVVKNALKLKKLGNDIVNLVGGREIHPINVRVGGFYSAPPVNAMKALGEKLRWARDAAVETARWTAKLPFPSFERDYEFVCLRHPSEYPLNEGRIVSSRGLDISVNEYEFYFQEEHMAHANALHSRMKERGEYHVGPLARFNLNYDRLPALAKSVAEEVKLAPPVLNPFKSIVARAIELVFACDEAIRIIDAYTIPERSFVPVKPQAGLGFGATEAPRGLLYHRYRIGDGDLITDAKIVPPTAQNQKSIEQDLREFVAANSSLSRDELTLRCEQAVRNYDPCISCATHFVDLQFED